VWEDTYFVGGGSLTRGEEIDLSKAPSEGERKQTATGNGDL